MGIIEKMLGWLLSLIGKEFIIRAVNWPRRFWTDWKRRRALVEGGKATAIDFLTLVPEKLKHLADSKLPDQFDKPAIREWLSDPKTQSAFAGSFERNPSSLVPDLEARCRIETQFEVHTGETRKNATGYINGFYE